MSLYSCRQERLSQQPLRTASLQHVHKIRACSKTGFGSFWLAGAAPHSACYLISRSPNGSWSLLDPSHEAAQPKQLAFRSQAPECHAFITSDEQLHIVECVPDKSRPQRWNASHLRWHIIDAATGLTLASEHKHFWPQCREPTLQSISHASGLVLCLVDVHHLAIMDSRTRHELARCDISPRHSETLTDGSGMLDEVAWSCSGSMLAVSIRSGYCRTDAGVGVRDSRPLVAEVQIFDSASGSCLQAFPKWINTVSLLWSPGSDLLAVNSFVWECCKEYSSSGVHDMNFVRTVCEPAAFVAELRLLRPQFMEVSLVKGALDCGSRPIEWTEVSWSPNGHLLVAGWEHGCTIVDPNTLNHLITFLHCRGSVDWAPSALPKPSLIAFFPWQGNYIWGRIYNFCCRETGEWECSACKAPGKFEPLWTAHLSPNGASLVGTRSSATGHVCASHSSLHASRSDGFIMPTRPLWKATTLGSDRLWLQFAPLPACWPQIYAYVHESCRAKKTASQASSPSTGPAAISLVNSDHVAVLGTWSIKHLDKMVQGRRLRDDVIDQVHNVRWAPNGKHLAVYCGSCTLVMTFDTFS